MYIRDVFNWVSLNQNQGNFSDQSQETKTKPKKARENERVQLVIGFDFASHWLRKWREFCQPIKERSKQNQSKRWITFDTQLKKFYWATRTESNAFQVG